MVALGTNSERSCFFVNKEISYGGIEESTQWIKDKLEIKGRDGIIPRRVFLRGWEGEHK